MPSTLIEVRRAYTPDEQVALINAVHAALGNARHGKHLGATSRLTRPSASRPHRTSGNSRVSSRPLGATSGHPTSGSGRRGGP